MAEKHLVDPVHQQDVPRVDNAVDVGEDLAFQERWWLFERIIWSFFALVLLADVLGFFGHGWFANARLARPETGMSIKYERVERTDTPSVMSLQIAPDAAQNGSVHLFISESIVKALGADRVIPEPAQSVIGHGGITYTFPANGPNSTVSFELMPASPGIFHWTMQIAGKQPVGASVVVMP